MNTKHSIRKLASALAVAAGLIRGGFAHAETAADPKEDGGKTLAPYFLVKSGDSQADAMPLKSTTVDVKVAGVIADVHVTQLYSNAGSEPLEAVYVFPGSTRAAVYGMQMRIGERVLTARVQERAEARRTFEKAKSAGKRSSLLEQHRPNVFQMSVANILPGETVQVDLRYTELLVPEEGEYAFVFPTVVGPRYSNRPEASAAREARWIGNPFLGKGEASSSTFDIRVELAAGMPIRDLRCATHEVRSDFADATRVRVSLRDAEDAKPQNDRDYILKYRLADRKIESGLLLSRGEKENFFALMVEPPRRVTSSQIVPREYLFVIDVSGSMNGFPLEVSKSLLRELFKSLRPVDSFNVLLFAGGSKLLSKESLPATRENLEAAFAVIDGEQGGGGTELLPALKQALKIPVDHRSATVSRSIVVITDGYVDCEPEAFELIRASLEEANLFAFGIGSSVNRFVIEGMARAGRGEPFIVTSPADAPAEAARFLKYATAPILAHLRLSADGFEIYDVEPASLPDMLAERPVLVFGKWKGEPKGEIVLEGASAEGGYVRRFKVADAGPVENTGALAYLWARSRIATLSDDNQLSAKPERVREITGLGLAYNLLTAHTSFVAVDDTPADASGRPPTRVSQPLPLPQGVEASAVGNGLNSTPEPETWAMLLVLAGILGWKFFTRKAA